MDGMGVPLGSDIEMKKQPEVSDHELAIAIADARTSQERTGLLARAASERVSNLLFKEATKGEITPEKSDILFFLARCPHTATEVLLKLSCSPYRSLAYAARFTLRMSPEIPEFERVAIEAPAKSVVKIPGRSSSRRRRGSSANKPTSHAR